MNDTRISDMPAKICAEVCTLYVKGSGCTAKKTPNGHCPVGKQRAERWMLEKEGK